MIYWSWATLFMFSLFVLLQYNGCLGCLEEERISLLQFKASRAPDSEALVTWVNDKGSDCCAWAQVKCSNTTRRVVQLSVNGTFGVSSLLNASVFLPFEELQHLDLSHNYINGWTTNGGFERLSKLKNLEVLNLERNQFNNSVLPSLGALTSLKTLILALNSLDGSLSESSQGVEIWSKLKKLEVLNLNGNYLNNSIVPFLGSLASLKTLDLGENRLEGSLSEFSQVFSNLSNLEGLTLSSNLLNGFSPFHDSGKMSKLKILDLSGNNFSSKIPQSILSLDSLEALSLRDTHIKDSISGFCKLENLKELDLRANKFEGNLPPCLNNLTSLRMIDFSQNQLRGRILPSLISNLKSLEYISLSQNQFQATFTFSSSINHKFQLRFLALSDCNLNTSTSDLVNFLHNQYDLRHVDISNNNLHGNFPNWLIENNTRLETLVLVNNSLTGHIHFPTNLGVNLHSIDISNNNILGKIQTNIGYVLSELLYLNISKNRLQGSIPSSLGNMKKLFVLDLSSNNFSGEVPASLALGCKTLSVLILSNNRLHGQISPAFFNLTYANTLRLNNNQFTGHIPNDAVGFITLYTLDISGNRISGRIPTWIANLSVLTTLVMRDNSFDGPIPQELCHLDTVRYLDLSQNHLSGSIPPCLMNLSSIRYLHLQGNNLTGSIPKALPEWSNLATLDLKHNKLSGSIPSWSGSLSNLRILLLKGNHFSGSIPRELCRLNKIGILDLSHNMLSGSIPTCFSNITFGKNRDTELIYEDEFWTTVVTYAYPGLLKNEYSGSVTFMYRYTEEEVVEFMSNSYKGHILTAMSGIDLSYNNFTGQIPLEVGALTAVRALNLSHNQFTGRIPTTLSNLKQLETMDLSHNKLTGQIPSELTGIYSLKVFTVAYNNLSGRIPNMKAQVGTFGETSYKGNPYLCGPPLRKQCTL